MVDRGDGLSPSVGASMLRAAFRRCTQVRRV